MNRDTVKRELQRYCLAHTHRDTSSRVITSVCLKVSVCVSVFVCPSLVQTQRTQLYDTLTATVLFTLQQKDKI